MLESNMASALMGFGCLLEFQMGLLFFDINVENKLSYHNTVKALKFITDSFTELSSTDTYEEFWINIEFEV